MNEPIVMEWPNGVVSSLAPNQWDIATGKRTDMALSKVHKYRQRWAEEGHELPELVVSKRANRRSIGNGGQRRTTSTIGTQLTRILKREGLSIPGCEKCTGKDGLAARLNKMTAAQVRAEMTDIVDDMATRVDKLPRLRDRILAKTDLAISKAVPKVVEKHVPMLGETKRRIQAFVEEAIEASEASFRRTVKGFRHQAKRTGPPVKRIELHCDVRRNLIYHIYPVKEKRWLWQWNLDQILERIDLFNGRRVIAIVTDKTTDHFEMVKCYLRGHGFEFIVEQNDTSRKPRGETVTAVQLMQRVHSFEREVTFRAHAKGVTKVFGLPPTYNRTASGEFSRNGETVKDWTEIMYATSLDDWGTVREQLEQFAMTGPFRRFTRLGHAAWFFSGSFYWYEHTRFYQRDWKNIQDSRIGVESLPGVLFNAEDVGCLHGDKCASLYHHDYMEKHAWPDFEKWKAETVPNRVLAPGKLTPPRHFGKLRGNLQEMLRYAETRPSDINEHVHALKSLSSRCDHVTEFGVRFGVSTVAMLSGRPVTLRSYDLEQPQNIRALCAIVPEETSWSFEVADTLKLDIAETDLLFIDTLHEYDQLRQELALHGNKARKYLAFHDTVTFGERGELGGGGLNRAIDEFMEANPHWVAMADFRNCNGLRVLRRL